MRKPTRRDSSLIAAPTRVAGGGSTAEAVGEDDPVDALAGGLGALVAAVPDPLGVDRGLDQIERHRIDRAQHVEIDEAVVHRGDDPDLRQAPVRHARQQGVAAGGVDQDDVGHGAERRSIAASSPASVWSSSTS